VPSRRQGQIGIRDREKSLSKKPVKCPDGKKDKGHFFVEWKCGPRQWRYAIFGILFHNAAIFAPLQPANWRASGAPFFWTYFRRSVKSRCPAASVTVLEGGRLNKSGELPL
ncbi:hypothetical protein, partial [Methanoregula sp.]|uniref:hypothetical protein n=1 Tax=Methanoregula sp. TaxID=2052170 RepID=UPI0025DEBFFB